MRKLNMALKQKPKFSLVVLLSFVLVFTIVGIYIIYSSFAARKTDYLAGDYDLPGKSMVRIWGDDRYDTAAGVSQNTYPNPSGGGTVVLASGSDWPDATTAAVLAKAYNSPILLTPSYKLSDFTLAEIKRLAPTNIIIVGGELAVSPDVEAQINDKRGGLNVNITRVAGVSRYDTAAQIATRVKEIQGSIPDKTAFIVTGRNFPDVLSVGPVAAYKGYPILYVDPTKSTIPSYTKNALTTLGITDTVIIGGTAAVPDALASQLPSPERISGSNRFATSVNVANWAIRNFPEFDKTNVGIASGYDFPDALTAGPYLASKSKPGVLILASDRSSDLAYAQSFIKDATNVEVFGGPAALSEASMRLLRLAFGSYYSEEHIQAEAILDNYIKDCPILAGSTVSYSPSTPNPNAVAYPMSGRISVNPSHTVSISTIMAHEIWHIIDYRYDGAINWGERIPPKGGFSQYCYR